jgi:hypothetical protein
MPLPYPYLSRSMVYLLLLACQNSKLFLLADYGVESYNIGTGFGHFGIAVEDVSFYIF